VAEHVEDGLLREIDEEIRQENFAKLWKKYGNFVIAAAVVLVASVGGYKAWQGYDLKERSRQGVEFASALKMANDNKAPEALEILSKLEVTSGAGYALLAQFQGARLQIRGPKGAARPLDTQALPGDRRHPDAPRGQRQLQGDAAAHPHQQAHGRRDRNQRPTGRRAPPSRAHLPAPGGAPGPRPTRFLRLGA